MKHSDLIGIVINTALSYWWVLVLLVVILFLKTPLFKGWFGEFIVNLSLKLNLNKQYHIHNNVTLPTQSGSTQVDHIVVSRHGVFVIETKHLKGWIFGSEKQANWTQCIYKKKVQFQNPLRQNYKHTQTLIKLLGLDPDFVHSLIVFVGNYKMKTVMPSNVCNGRKLIQSIKSHQYLVFSEGEVNNINNSIKTKQFKKSLRTRQDHIKHVTEIIDSKKNLCPRCGNELVERQVKKGDNAGKKFLGCRSFPSCRYIENI